MAIDLHKRITTAEVEKAKAGKQVILAGWAQEVRDLGKLAFIILRDREGTAQLVALKDFKDLNKIKALTRESVIAVEGAVQDSKAKDFKKEIKITGIEVLSNAEPLPIDVFGKVETDLSKRLDYRYIDLRHPKQLAIFKVRSEVARAVREYFYKNGFIEMQTPKLVGMGAEGGATLFELPYYGKKAYLAQSQQFYKQMMQISGFERVFEIGPSFRAEKSHTMRHLTEFSHIDVEMSFIKDEENILKIEEGLLVYVLKAVKKNCAKELKFLNVKIEVPKLPLPRVMHKEAVKMLEAAGCKIRNGDIGTEEEKKLGELVKKKYKTDAFFLTKFPWNLDVCKFYSMRDGDFGRVADFEYKGQEISTGAQREHRHEVLAKQIKEKGLNPKDFEYYIEPFKAGCPPHSGFGMGLDRLTQFILNIPNIREVVLYPRDPERLTP